MSGRLAPGSQLPASRDLAAQLDVNRTTVTNAYDELVKAGVARSHVGQGTFVAIPAPPKSMRWSFSRAVESARARVRPAIEPTGHADSIDFASLVPDEELFPVEAFRVVLDDVLRRKGKELLQYGPAAGYPPLREHIAARLSEGGIRADANNVLIVNGTQQALDLICRTLLDPGDRVAVESPTYTIILPLLAQYQAQVSEVPMTPRGMDLTALERLLDRFVPKFIFTMPTFHNPTGISMDEEARRDLLKIASRHRVPIIEDDFDSELRFDGAPLASLKALDEEQSVIHIGTFSKGLFPGVRLGWIVAPDAVVETIVRSKLISDYHTSLLPQAAVLEFCRRGHYDAHLKTLATICREKNQVLLSALERHFPDGVHWTRPQGGFAYWITLPEGLSTDKLVRECADQGVRFTPGGHFSARGDGQRSLRLSVSRVPLERIEDGVRRLGEVLEREMKALTHPSTAGPSEHEPALHI